MYKRLRNTAHALLKNCGLEVKRRRSGTLGHDAFVDMAHFVGSAQPDGPLIFDVGANVGQTAQRFLRQFPRGRAHCFEPSPTTFRELSHQIGKLPTVKLWNVGVGSSAGVLPFKENAHSVMGSFLQPHESTWGKVDRVINVPVITLDGFAAEAKIDKIDILKSDTQGFDLEVFKGADGLLTSGSISMVYFELTFSHLYKSAPPFSSVLALLEEKNYRLVSFYPMIYEYDLAGWTDALFIHNSYYQAWAATRWNRPAN